MTLPGVSGEGLTQALRRTLGSDEAWRLERDYFYDRGMHGVDWPAMRRKYEPLVERVASRAAEQGFTNVSFFRPETGRSLLLTYDVSF